MCHYQPPVSVLTVDHAQFDPPPTNAQDTQSPGEFLELAADSIVAILHEPSSLGLSEAEAIEMASAFLIDALETLSSLAVSAAELIPRDATLSGLGRAADLLRSIARQL